MTKQVLLRDRRHDAIKSALAFSQMGSESPDARSWAVRRWGEAGAPKFVDKAVASPISTDSMDATSISGVVDRELFAAVREKAILFRMRGVRRTGFNIRSIAVRNSVAAWVAEGQPIPVLQPTIDAAGLDVAKVAALSVWTQTALETSPGIEGLIFADLVKALIDGLDLALLDPANAGAGVEPASLTNGAPAILSTGNLEVDLAALIAAFDGDLGSAYFTTTPDVATALATAPVGRDIGARGGELLGIPALTSPTAPAGQLALVDPSAVQAAWDENFQLETTKQGSVIMDDAPLGGAQNLVSLFQLNLVAFRAIAPVAWSAARPAAAILTGL